ncbi:MAG: lactate utilization protein [Alistipes sp.]|nr:lactate utilization protein [Alistipes sp.]
MSSHSVKAKAFLKNGSRASWHDKALYAVREKRDKQAYSLPEWEELRDAASAIKEHTLSHLAEYLEEFERNATANGIKVHWAESGEAMNEIVAEIIAERGAKHLVKSKSMLAEECHLAPYLEERGVEVVESDLGERIVQLMHCAPSHIVLPAIHIKREEVGELFERELATEKGNSDPTYLTHEARKHLREKFLSADVSMTGVNFAIAEEGAFAVCTNEGNADMGTSFTSTHIAIMGLEKVIPDMASLGVFTRLLARSATGQPITTYTSIYRKPEEGKEIHLIIVDNGRTQSLADEEHRNMLKCMRCGACMNTCPVYRRTGGYSYSYFIPGPLGINLGMLRSPEAYGGNVSGCSLCYSCSGVCPAKVDLAEQIYKWRQQMSPLGVADGKKKLMVKAMNLLMRNPRLFNTALAVVPYVPRLIYSNSINPWYASGREMPHFAAKSFRVLWREGVVKKEAKR